MFFVVFTVNGAFDVSVRKHIQLLMEGWYPSLVASYEVSMGTAGADVDDEVVTLGVGKREIAVVNRELRTFFVHVVAPFGRPPSLLYGSLRELVCQEATKEKEKWPPGHLSLVYFLPYGLRSRSRSFL